MTNIRFGTDGWRGVIADDMTFANVRLVARAIALTVKSEQSRPRDAPPRLLVGHDTRFLSRQFAEEAAKAIAGEGVAVKLTVTFAPTPAFSYAVVNERADGAVVITASHNPPEYNGVKFKSSYGGSAPISFTQKVEERIRELEAREGGDREAGGGRREAGKGDACESDLRTSHANETCDEELGPSPVRKEPSQRSSASVFRNVPAVELFDPREAWLDRLEELVDVTRIGKSGVAVALDVMYGAAQGLLSSRLERAGCEVRELHADVNPGFGGLHPEPIPANMGALIDCMKTWGASPRAGFAFDGDSDRLAPVDEDGRVITPHETLALLLRHVTRHRGMRGPVVKSVNIGRMVEAEARALGLPVVVTPVGFKHIAEAMRAHDAVIGGEESGGFAMRGHIPERDPGLISLLLLESMAMSGKSLGTLLREMEVEYGPHRYGRIDLRLPTLEHRDRVVASVKANPPDPLLGRRLAEVEMMDGVRLMFADGSWIMVRASGTEPLLRIYAEAASEADVEALLAWGRSRARERSYR